MKGKRNELVKGEILSGKSEPRLQFMDRLKWKNGTLIRRQREKFTIKTVVDIQQWDSSSHTEREIHN